MTVKRIVIELGIIIFGTVIAAGIIKGCGIDKGSGKNVNMKANKGNNIQIEKIEYSKTVHNYNISAKDIATGTTFNVMSPDVATLPHVFKSAIEDYLKSHNLTEEELRKGR